MARYECAVCGYVYDDARERVPWDELPSDWTCPTCGADQTLFERLAGDGPEENSLAPAETPSEPAAATSVSPSGPAVCNTAVEPTLELIHALARDGLAVVGSHGPMGAMGVPRPRCRVGTTSRFSRPSWPPGRLPRMFRWAPICSSAPNREDRCGWRFRFSSPT